MMHIILASTSIIFQITTIILAFILLKRTKLFYPLLTFIFAIFLMGLRNIYTIYNIIYSDFSNSDLILSGFSLLISFLILVGFSLITPAIKLERAKDEKIKNKLISQADEFKQWTNAGTIGIIRTNIKGIIYEANDTFLTMLGYTRQELYDGKLNWDILTPPEYSQLHEKISATNNHTKKWTSFENELFHKNGQRIPIMYSGSSMNMDRAEYTFLIIELTDFNKSLKLQQHLRYAIDQHVIVATTDYKGDLTYVNEKFCQISGYNKEELLGQNYRMINSGQHPQKFFKDLWQTISDGGIWHGEICNKTKNGKLYWVETTIIPLLDSKGNILEYTTLRTDVTIRRLTEEKLRHSQKMDALGQLSGGLAHDFNNILGIIMGNLEVIKKLSTHNDNILMSANTAYKGAVRGANLTKKLLGYSRKTQHSIEQLSVNKSIEKTSDVISSSITASIDFKLNLAENLWLVNIDRDDFKGAIINLALNARDAMPNHGELLIETANIILDEKHMDYNPEIDGNEFIVISVQDKGIGMSDDVKSRILEPFYTTKPASEGTGLGLSMVHGFVNRSGGYLKIYSQVGKGTTIKIFIPKAKTEIKKQLSNNEELDISMLQGDETILIVDDEISLRHTTEIHLNYMGYNILSASNATDALAIIQKNKNIDLLFSDVVMPGNMDGFELAIKVEKLNPSIKMLLASGFTQKFENYKNSEDVTLSRLAENLLNKPYNKIELAVAVRKTLDT